MFQSKIVTFDEVGESLDDVGECGGPAVAQRCFFGYFFLGNKRAEKSCQRGDVSFIEMRQKIV